jgi:hypothetical protein
MSKLVLQHGSHKATVTVASAFLGWYHAAAMHVFSFMGLLVKFVSYSGACHLLCGLVVRVPGYRPRGLGSIPGTTRFSEK